MTDNLESQIRAWTKAVDDPILIEDVRSRSYGRPPTNKRGLVVLAAAAVLLLIAGVAVVRAGSDDSSDVETVDSADSDGQETTTTWTSAAAPDPAEPVMIVRDGALVRGAEVEVGFVGLVETAGEVVSITVRTPEPTDGRPGYWEAGTGTVADDGTLQTSMVVPNALTGEDDIIPVEPSQQYRLTVQSIDHADLVDTLSLVVEPAKQGVRYPVVAWPGPVECGAPPTVIGFDGKTWAPTSPPKLDVPETGLEGTFRTTSTDKAEFAPATGPSVEFETVPGYSC